MKFPVMPIGQRVMWRSRPARGGWVEISPFRLVRRMWGCPAPHGAGGLKCNF